jgi:hypothetical protein
MNRRVTCIYWMIRCPEDSCFRIRGRNINIRGGHDWLWESNLPNDQWSMLNDQCSIVDGTRSEFLAGYRLRIVGKLEPVFRRIFTNIA